MVLYNYLLIVGERQHVSKEGYIAPRCARSAMMAVCCLHSKGLETEKKKAPGHKTFDEFCIQFDMTPGFKPFTILSFNLGNSQNIHDFIGK